MPVSAAAAELYSFEVRRLYEEAEEIMLQKVAKRLGRGITSTGWAEEKLAEVASVGKDIRVEIVRLRRLNPKVADAVEAAYNNGAKAAVEDLRKSNLTDLQGSTALGRGGAVKILVQDTVGALESLQFAVLRKIKDDYRSIIAEAASLEKSGAIGLHEAVQSSLYRFADKGISGFVDAAGRNWDLSSYAEMAVRTAEGKASVEGHTAKLIANSQDVGIVNYSFEPCESCAKWEGRKISLAGRTPGLPTMDSIRRSKTHLFGPNCTHSIELWVEGLSKKPVPVDRDEQIKHYQERQQQRYNERQIRKWKKRKGVALTELESRRCNNMVQAWQAEQRRFIEETGRRRDYWRESLRKPKALSA